MPIIQANEDKPGSTGLLTTLVGEAIWALGLAALALESRLALPYFVLLTAATTAMFGGQIAAIGFILLAGEYTGRITVTRRRLVALVVLIAFAQLPSITDPLHHLMWGGSSLPLINRGAIGPVGAGLLLLGVLITFIALLMFLVTALTTRGLRRKQSFILFLAGGSTSAFYAFDSYVFTELDFLIFPLGFIVSGVVYAWALFRADFLNIVPIARERIIEEMDDAAVIVDSSDRVVECNPAALQLATVDSDYTGMPLAEFFEMTPEMFEQVAGTYGVDTEITVTFDGEKHHFDLNISRIDESGVVSADPGRLIVLRDITRLKNREAELEFLQQIQTRVLRHNIRNDLTVVRGYAELLAENGDDQDAELVGAITEKTDELLSLSQKARMIERLIDRDATTDSVDLSATLEELGESLRTQYPTASISVTAPDQCLVETDPLLEVVFEILLENAVEHNDTAHPTVEVSLDHDQSDATTVTIADDGPGIPQTELEVLEEGEETPLKHGSGIGLWIVQWIIDHSAASIAFDTTGDGTRVTIHIPE